ncbi:E3 ubiquitin-protein ligase hrd1 [Didymosphaeria variabile]|uniref:RING-type E3 ubiquitin transferase n=1 Tax=Didymosphaeria variabile TaxID=1932322 RepID=A0A9W8XFY1_9PLEO|nr:E3 ubiquitin-protein ligase hrd1 [Didymosphaeria variabile]KAJ4348248.1 E3 ubiquitin-protein ligase hrd1 [Didymosphaeria variabile]
MSRLQIYIASSAVLANIVLLRAFVERPNFYSATVYISQSTGSILFLANLAVIVMGSAGYGLQRLFYGPLRPIETEQLYDKAWFAVSETLLAMTIFRDDIGLWFFAMFLCLLAGKVWQWIGEGRVEFLEQQPPANPKLFHARLMSSLVLSVGYDLFMVFYCVDSILADARAGVMVMFGFEYVLLAIASISTLLRYGLSLVELAITHRQEKVRDEARRVAREQARQRREAAEAAGELVAEEEEEDDDDDEVPGWEEKGRWVFFLDLMTDAIKSVVYMVFFFLLLTFYGIPIHIVRDLFMTLRSFVKRLHDFYQYRNATRDMNARYPDATADELERENTCIVCREEMQPWVEPGADGAQPGRRRMDERQRPKKLPCGHILHFNCLRSWLERQQVCPTCRRSVLAQPVTPTNPQNQANAGQINPAALPGGDPLRGLLGNMQPPAAPGQPGQYHPAPQIGQPNLPQGNVRVFNFGPVRIALGNLRLPANRPADANANANNNNLLMERLAQQIAQQPNALQPQVQVQNQGIPQLPNTSTQLPLGGVPHHPNDIQGDILRIQQNIIASLQQLQVQHHQLENIQALLAELNRLQQASGAASAGQELPPITSLNPQPFSPTNPQAYFANGPVLRQGDGGVPEGLTLPEGWTLRPMALSPQAGNMHGQATEAGPSGTARRYFPTVQRSSAPPPHSSSSPPTASDSGAGPASSAAEPKSSEPSSLGSSWSFDNASNNDAQGSSSAVAGSSSEGQGSSQLRARPSAAGSSAPRPVTVEETDDE